MHANRRSFLIAAAFVALGAAAWAAAYPLTVTDDGGTSVTVAATPSARPVPSRTPATTSESQWARR